MNFGLDPKDLIKIGIYCIKINNHLYIGSTTISFYRRFKSHLNLLNKNKHFNIHFQNCYNKYKSIQFEIIEACTKEVCLKREQYYLNLLNPDLNISKSSSSPMLGRKHSEKTRKKLSGRIPWNLNKPRTNEEKLKMSQNKKEINKTRTLEYWKNISEIHKKLNQKSFLGKHHSAENKKLLRNKRKDKKGKILCVNTGEIFEAQLDIQRKYNIKQGHISEILNGKRTHTGGFFFKYIECETKKHNGRTFLIRDNFGNIFTNLMKAVKHHKLNYQPINKYLRFNKSITINNITLEIYEP